MVIEYWTGTDRVFVCLCGPCGWSGGIVLVARVIGHEAAGRVFVRFAGGRAPAVWGLDEVELDGQGWLAEGLPGVGERFGFDAAVQCG